MTGWFDGHLLRSGCALAACVLERFFDLLGRAGRPFFENSEASLLFEEIIEGGARVVWPADFLRHSSTHATAASRPSSGLRLLRGHFTGHRHARRE